MLPRFFCSPNSPVINFVSVLWITAVLALAASGMVSSAVALCLGIVFALVTGNPFLNLCRRSSTWCLCLAVVGLGAGIDIGMVGRSGMANLFTTLSFICITFLISYLLGRFTRCNGEIMTLISSGTAICGGSAIAAVSSAIGAKAENVSVALGCVFLLNAVALILFPMLGVWFGLDQRQFGLWSALAIHDTSSVVGASIQFGPESLAVATTTKLVRALWIAPLALVIGFAKAKGIGWATLKKQWFIAGFLALSCVFTWVPEFRNYAHAVTLVSKRLMVITLFLIGSAFSWENLKQVGIWPLIHSVLLWISMASISVLLVRMNWF